MSGWQGVSGVWYLAMRTRDVTGSRSTPEPGLFHETIRAWQEPNRACFIRARCGRTIRVYGIEGHDGVTLPKAAYCSQCRRISVPLAVYVAQSEGARLAREERE